MDNIRPFWDIHEEDMPLCSLTVDVAGNPSDEIWVVPYPTRREGEDRPFLSLLILYVKDAGEAYEQKDLLCTFQEEDVFNFVRACMEIVKGGTFGPRPEQVAVALAETMLHRKFRKDMHGKGK